MKWIQQFIIPSLLPICLCTCSLKNTQPDSKSFWSIINHGASQERIIEITDTLLTCDAALAKLIPSQPQKLTVFAFGNREDFVIGLQRELGYPKEHAEYFRKSASPRPVQNKLLIPPQQTPTNICHELTHHFVESSVSLKKLLQTKWFDEGLASLLADQILNPDILQERTYWSKKLSADGYLHLHQMRTEKQWGELHRVQRLRSKAYLQARLFVHRLLQQCGKESLLPILTTSENYQIEDAIEYICKFDIEQLHQNWVENELGGSFMSDKNIEQKSK